MTVETVTTINTLDPTLPTANDLPAEAPQHLRNIKSALKTTFPNVDGPVTASDEDLSALGSLRSNAIRGDATALQNIGSSLALPVAGTGIATSSTGYLNAGVIQQQGVPLIPRGIITLWAGPIGQIPNGWHLCDGTAGTPDLRDRFVVGAGAGYTAGDFGGSSGLTITTTSNGGHSHGGSTGAAGGHTHTGFTDAQGLHAHSGNSGSTALTVDQLPPHSHTYGAGSASGGTSTLPGGASGSPQPHQGPTDNTGGGLGHTHPIVSDGQHAHGLNTSTAADHQHAIAVDGTHGHSATFDNRPPYFALCYIMKS